VEGRGTNSEVESDSGDSFGERDRVTEDIISSCNTEDSVGGEAIVFRGAEVAKVKSASISFSCRSVKFQNTTTPYENTNTEHQQGF